MIFDTFLLSVNICTLSLHCQKHVLSVTYLYYCDIRPRYLINLCENSKLTELIQVSYRLYVLERCPRGRRRRTRNPLCGLSASRVRIPLSPYRYFTRHTFGEVSEWSKVHDWKSCKVKSLRGFESPPLR